jgi:outer membrane protein TolC
LAVNSRLRKISAPAEQKAAAASYVGSALRAFEEVEDALAAITICVNAKARWSDAVSSSADSVKFSREQLEQGQIDMFTVLRLTGENLAAKVQLTQVRASRLRERVNLYLALGGDFAGTGAPK